MTTTKTTLTKAQERFFSKPRTMLEIMNDLFKGDSWAANSFQNEQLLACNLWLTKNLEFVALKKGDKVEILCHNYKDGEDHWLPGVYEQKVSATDRNYRINCRLDNGIKIEAAAPECVRPVI